MTELKFCKDCLWYKKEWIEHLTFSGDRYDKCLCPVFGKNLVTGRNYEGKFCHNARDYEIYCGESGKHWVAKND